MGKRSEYAAVLQDPNSNMSSKEGEKFQQYLSAVIAAVGAAVIGSILAWTSPMEPLMVDTESSSPIHASREESSWVASLVTVGAVFGALPAGMFANMLGRKTALIVLAVPWILSWLLVLFAQSVLWLYISRLMSGVITGAVSTIVPTYVAEISEVSIRGALGSLFQLFITIGILYSYAFGATQSYFILAAACLGLSAIYLLALFLIPESPLYLVSKGKFSQAEASLRKLRGPSYDVNNELREMQKNLESSTEKKFSFDMLSSKANVKALIIAFGLMIFQQLSGINAVIFFSGTIFKDAGSSLSPTISSVILGVVQCIATFSSGFLMDRAGRRSLLLLSDFVMAVCLGVLGYNFWLKEQGHDITEIGWVPLSSLLVFIVVFSLGLGPIPWMMTGELFSPEIKGFATGIAVALNWIQTFIVTRFFHDLTVVIGSSYTFWLFSGVCLVGTAFIFLMVPETKGKTLQQIQMELAGKTYSPRTNGNA